MKKQTYIAYFKDDAGKLVTFERFSYARIKRVKEDIRTLLRSDLYMTCVKGTKTVEIYATPNGNSPELIPECIILI